MAATDFFLTKDEGHRVQDTKHHLDTQIFRLADDDDDDFHLLELMQGSERQRQGWKGYCGGEIWHNNHLIITITISALCQSGASCD